MRMYRLCYKIPGFAAQAKKTEKESGRRLYTSPASV